MFDKVAAGALGKPLMTILHQRYPGYTTANELAVAVRYDVFIPPEITRLVGKNCKLMVSISKKWKSQRNADKLSFQVNRIEETFKPDLPSSVFDTTFGSAGPSSSGAGLGSQTNAIVPIIWPSPTTPHVHVSPTAQTLRSDVKLSPSTPAPRSSTPKHGTRRSLFKTPTKKQATPTKEHVSNEKVTVEAPAEEAAVEETTIKEVVVTAEDKDAQELGEKSKAVARDKEELQKAKRNKKNK